MVVILFITINYFRKNEVKNFVFSENDISVTYVFGKKEVRGYKDIKKIVENKEGFLPITVNRVYFYDRKKCTYFYCPNSKRKDLDDFLQSKGLKIRPQP